jgi:hypothetical protein
VTTYIVVEAAPCDGGRQIARVLPGEDEEDTARRYGACVRCYGRGCPHEPQADAGHSWAGAERCLASLDAE